MKRLKEVKEVVEILLNYLETHEGLTEEEKSNYGYYNRYYGREHYDAWKVREVISYKDYDRSQITKTMLKNMLEFLTFAERKNFLGDVWFNTGWHNGMYVSTRTGTDVEGETVLYHTFSSDENYWKLYKGRTFYERDEITRGRLTKREIDKFINDNKY